MKLFQVYQRRCGTYIVPVEKLSLFRSNQIKVLIFSKSKMINKSAFFTRYSPGFVENRINNSTWKKIE